MMGLFSVYTGFIYNDVLSRGTNIFGSSWRNPYNESTLQENDELELNPFEAYTGTPYFMGIDPAWMVSAFADEMTSPIKITFFYFS